MTSLYDLNQEYQKLLTKDEFTDADMAAIDNMHGLIEDKVVSCACVIRELKAKKLATDEAIKLAKDKSDRIQANINKLEHRVLTTLKENQIERIDKHPLFDVTLQTNRASVDDYDHSVIPAEYWKLKETYTLDKIKVKEDIEELGLVLPGVRLINKVVLKIG